MDLPLDQLLARQTRPTPSSPVVLEAPSHPVPPREKLRCPEQPVVTEETGCEWRGLREKDLGSPWASDLGPAGAGG